MSENKQQTKSEPSSDDTRPFTSVKIKQEKITPPSSPTHKPINSSEKQLVIVKQEKENNPTDTNEHLLSESVFATLLAPSDDKKSVELTKSSEELLAELFQSFNTAPPLTLNDETKSSKKAKKKHKKEKKKKHKKKGRSSSDEDNGDDKSEKKLKLKKVKKEKKDKLLDEKDIKTEKDKSKKRKSDEVTSTCKHKKKKKEKNEERKDELDIDEYEKRLLEKAREEENTKSDHPKVKSKIFIKSFKNSAVYEENVKQAEERKREKERKRDRYSDGEVQSDSEKSKSSEISLSDEETYERNRSRFYERDSSYGSRSRDDRHRSPRNRSRDRYESSYYGHGYRGLGSRYDDRDRDRRRFVPISFHNMKDCEVKHEHSFPDVDLDPDLDLLIVSIRSDCLKLLEKMQFQC